MLAAETGSDNMKMRRMILRMDSCSVPGKGCFAVHTYRAQDDARRLSLEHQLKELLQELRAMGVSEEDIQALCREGEAK